MRVYYCDHFELPLPEGHRFPIQKYEIARQKCVDLLGDRIQLTVAPAVEISDLERVHDRDYISRVFAGSLSQLEQKRIGFPWSPKMLQRSRRSVGATLAAAHQAWQHGIAAHLSGGTHHAFHDAGQGFCVFNDVAVAARSIQQHFDAESVLIVDLDVHQGNGTASIFAEDDSVFTFSMHGDRNFPFRKTAGDLDIGLPDGVEDGAYLSILKDALEQQIPQHVDLVLYIAGADPFRLDRMGRLKLSKSGLRRRDEMVVRHFLERQIPIAMVMGGGYGPVDDVADIHANSVAVAAECFEQYTRAPSKCD